MHTPTHNPADRSTRRRQRRRADLRRGPTPQCRVSFAPTGEQARRLNVDRRRCAGLSLLELLLALVGTAFIATAVAAMLDAVAYGAQSQRHLRELVPRHRLLSARLTDELGGAERVLQITATRVVLWYEDLDDDGITDTDELCWLDYDPAADTLVCQRAIDGIGVPLAALPDYELIRVGLALFNQLETMTLARQLTSLAITADTAAPSTALITWRAGFSVGDATDTDTQVYATQVGG